MSAAPASGAQGRERRRLHLDAGTGERAESVLAFPCSFAQERLWFLDQLEPGNVAYNLTVQIRLGRSVDAGALEAALAEVVRRHESLRTSFHTIDGRAVQVVHCAVAVPLEVLELPRAAQAGRVVQERARSPFDLTLAPLLRALLVRAADAPPALSLTMHHIVTDGWSMKVLEDELRSLYAAFVAGRPSPLPEPELQYADFAVWQRRRLSGRLRERQVAYWRRQLAGAPALLELARQRPRPAVQSFDGARQERWLAPALSDAVGTLARQQDATVFMTLLSAFAALLARLSGQSDVPIGTPIANRTRTELEGLLGFFVNTLVLRCDVSGNPSFRALLARISQTATGAYAHQDLPFEALVQELAPERHLAYSPLFQVMFNFVGDLDASAATARNGDRSPRRENPKFDLSLYAAQSGDRLRLSIVYRTDLFEHDMVSRMLDDLEALLERAAADPDAPVSQLAASAATAPPAAPRPRRRRSATVEQTIPARLARQVQRRPDSPAVVTDAHEWTYRDLAAAAGAVARGLRAGPSRSALLLEPGAPMLAGVLGALAAGRAYVPLDSRSPARRLTWLAADSGAGELLAEPATLALARRVAHEVGLPVHEIDPAARADLPAPAGAPSDLAYLLYTSGSTGRPKAVMQNHRNVLHFAHTYAERLELVPEDRMSLLASYAFDAGTMDQFGALASGACLFPFDVSSEGPQALPGWLARRRITVVHATPTLFRAMLAALPADADLSSVRAVVLGGEAAYRSDAELVREHFGPECVLVNGFGPTECSIALQHVVDRATPLRRTALPLGDPIDGIELELLDGAGEPIAGEGVGEIALRSAHVALGYHGRPDETDLAFRPAGDGLRVLRTGDLARRLGDGTLEFVGRRDAQVKVRGYRVDVGEIELCLRAIDGIEAVAVVVRQDALVAYLVAAAGSEPSVAAIRSRLRRELPDYLVPSQLVVLDRLPLTHNGKLDHGELPAPTRPRANGAAAPRSRTEELLADIWAEVLGGRVGIDESFFDAGGHSLLATRVVSRIRDAFGAELSLRAFFEGPTIAQLARRVDDDGDARPATDPIAPRPGGGPCPLSFAQQRLWFLDQLAPGEPTYNLSATYRLGAADPATVERALREIVRRHEVLRTTFDATDGRPVQVVSSDARLEFATVEAPVVARARRLAGEEARRPFDLRTGPLIRALLIRRGDGPDVLVLTIHHIVSDGWSMDVIDRELGVLCAAFEAGRQSPLPELPVQYADFAIWQRRRLSGDVLERDLRYWREQLAGAPASLDLPTDRPRPAAPSFEGSYAELELGPELAAALRALARREGVTLFMLLVSGFAALLHRLSGQDDVLVGTPIANRTRTELEGLVGFFVNTLVLRCDASGDPTFRTLLGRVRDAATGAYAHQDLPFEALVRDLAPERHLSHNPLFGVMFVLRQTAAGPVGDSVPPDTGTAKFDLTLAVDDDGRRMVATLEYRSDLFDRGTIERVLGQLRTLLEDVASDADRPLSELALLTPAQRRATLALGRGPGVGVPAGTIADLFEQRAASTPDALALVAGDTRLDFAQLNRRANRVAAGLGAAGIGSGALVALCAEPGVDRIAALLGVLKAGAAYVPLDPAHPTARLRAAVGQGCPSALIASAGARARHALPVATLELERLCDGADAPDRARATGAADLAYVICTSGSTGAPKSVAVEHRALASHVAAMRACYELRASDRVLALASLSFDVAAEEMFPTWCAGGAVVLGPDGARGSLDEFMACLADDAITVVNLPASYWHEWVAYLERGGLRPPAALRLVIAGSEPVRPDRLAQWRRLAPDGCRWLNAYGTTETTITSTVFEPPPQWANGAGSVPVGWPVGNARVVVVDAAGRPVPIGVSGELVIGGDGLARGYVGAPRLTAERFVELPGVGRVYRTGDLARIDERGCVSLLGRRDDQIKIRGYRVEPAELQAALLRRPAIQHAIALADHSREHTRLIAYVVAHPGEQPDTAALRDDLRDELPDYLLPSAIIALDELPLTPNGKLDRNALPTPDHRPQLPTPYTPPGTPTEQRLATIWQDILGLDRIGRHDNFFELGGDSILSLQVAARAHQAGLGLAVADVFRHQTIAELAAAGRTAAPAPDPPFTGIAPLTPIQRWFFEHVTEDIHHDNQALLLTIDAAVDTAMLRRALAQLVRRHDALRLRFTRTAAGWEQRVAAADGELPMADVDLASLPPGERPAELARRAALVQSSLDVSEGPIASFAHFAMGAGERDRLLIVIHHLAIDGVSWRILLDDLETALGGLGEGAAAALAPPTTSPLRWAERLVAHAHTPAVLAEAEHWPARAGAPLPALPVDHPGGRPGATVASERTLTAALGREETQALLREVPATFHSRTAEVLLATLTRAIASWTGEDAVRIALEAHGREPIADDLDVSRTVGWFTAMFPLVLRVDRAASRAAALRAVREQVRAIPDRGIGFGLLRYVVGDSRVCAVPEPEIVFNYLGRFSGGAGGRTLLAGAPESAGPVRSGRQARTHVFEVSAWVSRGRMRLAWSFSTALHEPATAQALLDDWVAELRAVIGAAGAGGPAAHGADEHDTYALSPLQHGMLFHTMLAPHAGEYVAQSVWELSADLDAPAYRRAWQAVVDRHAVLRTSFAWRDTSEPCQKVRTRARLPWREHDWRALAPDERADRLERLLDEDRRRGFDLERPPLLRLALIRWSDDTVKVLWSHHHLVLDGWSVQLLLAEVKAHYGALRRNEVAQLRPPRPYREFIEWLGRRDRSDDERWWRDTLHGFHTPTPLLPERTEPWPERHRPADHHALELVLDDDLSAQVERLARANRLTLSTILRGVWAILLSRYSAERDVVFGATVAGRPPDLTEADAIIGLFINTLPVRIAVADDEPVAAWMQRLQGQQAQLRDREHCSLADVQRWSDVAPSTALFESLLVVENYPRAAAARGAPAQPGLRRQRPLETASYPLALVVAPGDRIVLKAIYRPSRFDEPTVARALGHLRTILLAAARDPQMRVGDLPLLTEAEARHLLVELNDTGTRYPQRSLHALFEEQADRTPGAVAIVFGDEQLTYAELDRRANRLANHLLALGLQREGRVGIFLRRSVGAVVAALAIAKAGGAYVPLDPSYPPDRLAFMMRDAGVSFVVTNGEAAVQRSVPVVRFGDPAWDVPGRGEQRPAVIAEPGSLAYVIYTSGSTGRPKGVMVEQRAVVRLVLNTNYVTLTPDDRVALASNFAFDAATFELWGALLNGACLVGVPKEVALHPPALAAHLREQRISVIFITTALFNQVADHAPGAFAGVRHVMFGGEPADPRRVRAVLAGGPPALLMNVYGPTETTTFATFFPIEEMPPDGASSVPVGWPVGNARVVVVDAAGRPVPIGVSGELVIGGDGLARGYVGAPRLTAEHFVELPEIGRVYRTGDLARIDEHGCVSLLGRRDDQIKIRGYRVEPAELQAALLRRPAIQHAIALADHTREHTRLIAYVVAHPGEQPDTATLRDDLRDELPDYLLPSAIIALDELPLTPNGKLDRNALPTPDHQRPRLPTPFTPPATPTEQRLATIWQDILGLDRIGRHDNFFELGGHSLLATRVVSRIRDACSAEVSLHALFAGPTIAQLGACVVAAQATASSDPDPPLEAAARASFAATLDADGRLRLPPELRDRLIELAS